MNQTPVKAPRPTKRGTLDHQDVKFKYYALEQDLKYPAIAIGQWIGGRDIEAPEWALQACLARFIQSMLEIEPLIKPRGRPKAVRYDLILQMADIMQNSDKPLTAFSVATRLLKAEGLEGTQLDARRRTLLKHWKEAIQNEDVMAMAVVGMRSIRNMLSSSHK